MNDVCKLDPFPAISRRRFIVTAAATAFVSALPESVQGETSPIQKNNSEVVRLTGNGEFTYEIVHDWGVLPKGTQFGGTHGGIARDKAGHIYVSTQSATGVLVFSPEGRLLRTMAHEYPEVHSMVYAHENGEEYLYCTVQKGTPQENWLFIKMKINGTVVLKITAPAEAGFKTPNEWRLTAAVPAPDGSIFIANGYGDSRIFHFDSKGQYKTRYSSKGTTDGLLNCSHGLAVDTRYDQPLLLVCDRENRRLCHFDFDGNFVRTVTQHLRRPCQVSFHHDYAVVSELEGRITILDRDNVPVAFLGDNPKKDQWANYKLEPGSIVPACFSAAHGCFVDHDASIYVSDWNQTGRVTKLSRRVV